ncbi:casein kinase I [Tulasnella sp. 330]|nr:casein kinase I [Tulasnella sp. 330]KAG8885600.1 casein kinase I [Tulasnella sp. 331]KAG8889933.1 casein kinase I [Tulasnella sp. 332]
MSTHTSSSNNPAVVGVHYQVGKKIGEGSFGVVFEGVNLLNNQPVAIKFEPRKSDAPQLRDEYRSYRILNGCYGVPQVYHFGQEGLHNVLVIDLFGPNLEDLFDLCGRKFSIKTVVMVAKQMLSRVQTIHDKNLIYRDIKPDNFLIGPPGTQNASTIFIIDFGMAKQYRDPKTRQHIPYRERKSLSGTARYMSINTHLGREQSRRDDLESLGHVFMYFLRGGLPWQGLKAATNKQKYEKIGEKKQSTPIKELCEGFPEEFGIYLNYVRKLGFEENPDYDFLRDLLTKVLRNSGESEDGVYDWMMLNGGKGWEASASATALQASQRDPRQTPRGNDRAHRSSQQPQPGGTAAPPTTPQQVLVRSSSKRKPAGNLLIPSVGAGGPGAQTPASAVANVAVPAPSRRASGVPQTPTHQQTSAQVIQNSLSPPGGQHPYANPSAVDSGYRVNESSYNGHNNGTTTDVVNGREDSMMPGSYGGGRGASNGMPGTPPMSAAVRNDLPPTAHQSAQQQPHSKEPPKKSFVDYLLCRCG